MIDGNDAVRLALEDLNRDNRGYTFRLTGPPTRRSGDWMVGFEAIARDGHALVGDIVLVVNGESGEVLSLAEAISAGWRGDPKDLDF